MTLKCAANVFDHVRMANTRASGPRAREASQPEQGTVPNERPYGPRAWLERTARQLFGGLRQGAPS